MPTPFTKNENANTSNDIEMVVFDKKDDASSLLVSRPVAAFRDEFVDCFKDFIMEVNVLATGNAVYPTTVLDDVATIGIGTSAAIIDGVIAILGAIGLLSASLAAGLAVPFAIVGIAATYAFYKFRSHQVAKKYDRAEKLLERDDLSDEVVQIADIFTDMYRLQLESFTVKDAIKLANSSFKAISHEIIKNDEFDFNELLHPVSLQSILLRSISHMPKEKLNLNIKDELSLNTRDLIVRPALYCKETNRFYASDASEPRKYGVLYFENQADVDDYIDIVNKMKNDNVKWHYRNMSSTEVSLFKSHTLFSNYGKQSHFGGRSEKEYRQANMLTV